MQQKQQHPRVIFSVCAPTDTQWLEQWEAHLHPLKQAERLSIWSVRHLPAGGNRQSFLHDHLDQANIIILLLSADFFTDDECEALMERALLRQQQCAVQVIPLLLRPVAWHSTKLAPLTTLPSDGCPVTEWHNPDAAFDDCVRHLCRLFGHPVTTPLKQKPQRPSVEEQNRERMLLRLRRTYEELLAQSLAGVTQIELGLADKPDAVQNAVNFLFRTSTRKAQLLPPGTSILDVYDEAVDALLILGAPGAGKSTLLVELARKLVGRAEVNDTHPLSVILPLSSWAAKRPALEIWLAEQVAQIYDIPKNIAQDWIKQDQILPLLDGLDEMEEAARPACIAAINTYHRDHLWVPLVVCSRQIEYEKASKSQRLTLQNAVVVQPLTHEHVQAYLKQADKPLTALRHVLSTNPTLVSVATTPLMVHVLILTYRDTSIRPLSLQREQLQQQVWNDYVQRMIERKRDTQHDASHQTIARLGWLARQMRDHNQTILYVEQLQPDWLSKKQRSFYWWSMRLLSGLIFGLVYGLVAGLASGLIYGLIFGLISGLVSGFSGKKLTATNLPVSGQFSRETKNEDARRADYPEIPSVNVGRHGPSVLSPNRKLPRFIKMGMMTLGLGSGQAFRRIFEPIFGPSAQWNFPLLCVLALGVVFGLKAKIEPAEVLRWSWRNWKSKLVGVLIATLLFGLPVGLSFGWVYGWTYGLVSVLVYGLVLGFSGKQLTERLMLSPNEGIRRSVKNGLVVALVVGLVYGLVFELMHVMDGPMAGLVFELVVGLPYRLVYGLVVYGLIIGLVYGLGAAIQHYTLRFWLWRTHTFPWKVQQFLDEAVACILLRRVGGGYSFVHRLLLDYLADLPTGPTPTHE